MSQTRQEQLLREKPVFWGFLGVGILSLLGGILMFVQIVREEKQERLIPPDMQLLFTTVYSQQNILRNERGVYTPALIELGVNQETCRRYECLLTLKDGGQDYLFRMKRDDRTWVIQSRSPQPTEEK